MNVAPAWQKGYTGKGVVVSILDDGIQTNHPDLAENYVSIRMTKNGVHIKRISHFYDCESWHFNGDRRRHEIQRPHALPGLNLLSALCLRFMPTVRMLARYLFLSF